MEKPGEKTCVTFISGVNVRIHFSFILYCLHLYHSLLVHAINIMLFFIASIYISIPNASLYHSISYSLLPPSMSFFIASSTGVYASLASYQDRLTTRARPLIQRFLDSIRRDSLFDVSSTHQNSLNVSCILFGAKRKQSPLVYTKSLRTRVGCGLQTTS